MIKVANTILKNKRLHWYLSISSTLCSLLFLILVIGLTTYGVLHTSIIKIDSIVYKLFSIPPESILPAEFMLFFTYMANPGVVVGLQILLIITLVLLHRKYLAAFFLGGLLLGEVVSLLFKHLLARQRPLEVIYHLSRSGFSFPSGHALIAIVFYGFLGFSLSHTVTTQWKKIMIFLVTAGIVFLIGISRIFLGVHWFSDVVGGWLLGGVVLSLLMYIYYRIHERIREQPFTFPHGPTLVSLGLALIAVSFFIWYFYLTHPLVLLQSRFDSEIPEQ